MTKERFKGCGFESHQSRFYSNFYFPFLFFFSLKVPSLSPYPNSVFRLFSVPASVSALLSSLLTCLPWDLGLGEQDWGDGRQKGRESRRGRRDKGRPLALGHTGI